MRWPILDVLLVPGVDWADYFPATGAAKPRHVARLTANLSFLLERFRAYSVTATVGVFGETVRQEPELVLAIHAAGCEIAAMTDTARDPWTIPPGALRDEVEAVISAISELDLPSPVRFMPPFPSNQQLSAAHVAALREAGIQQALGCRGEGIDSLPLSTLFDWPLAGTVARLVPVWLTRRALGPAGGVLCLTPVDIDPGAPGGGWGRGACLRRLPRLLGDGFVAAERRAIDVAG
ncbi:MAG: polysaccharide deacetylase family protein [Candidatus Lernaella stagnicola]|nr:polysaccharide deacetylase family protein [Candidatus Lernaella stagnicola]